MMERGNRPRPGSVSDVTPGGSQDRDDLMTNWPEHVDAYLQYIADVMKMVGAPMGIRADLISLQGRVREQRRPGRVFGDQANRAPAGQRMTWPEPPQAVPPLERIVVQKSGLGAGTPIQTPEGAVSLNLPPGGLEEIPAEFRQGMAHVEESEQPRDLS